MKTTFKETLNTLRIQQHFTVKQLADRAKVPASLISGLQSGARVVGENNAEKIGMALGLIGEDLEAFIYQGVNTSTAKVLESSKHYPAEVLNLLATQFRSSGITPDAVSRCVIPATVKPVTTAAIFLNDGRKAVIEVKLSSN